MDIPTFNPKIESVNEYLRKVEKYRLSLDKHKYNLVLKFINDVFELDNKYTSLTSVKHIPVGKSSNLKETMETYQDDFKKHLKYEFEPDDIEDTDFCKIIVQLLKPIGYKLRTYTKYEKEYFTIAKK